MDNIVKFYVILVGTETAGNAGSVCRLMGNYEFYDLILVNPQYKSDDEALMLAHTKSGLDIYKNKKIYKNLKDAIDDLKLNTVIGFTRRIGKNREISINYREYFKSFFNNISRSEFINGLKYNIQNNSENFKRNLKNNFQNNIKNFTNNLEDNNILRIGLVFGRESSGLYTDEIKLCNLLLYIPTSSKSPSLNLSHATGIVLNEIFYNKILNTNLKGEDKSQLKKDDINTNIYEDSRPKELFLNGKSGMKWDVEKLNSPSTNEDRENFYNEIFKVAKRKNLFVRNDYYTFKKLFERIFNQPFISKRDLNYLKSLFMRFIYADVIEKRKK